ncbi:hypothetical protein L7F22_055590 [Adiantum nelumboides]|nr:hypothetical protein [Adiantum nelumboides]
MYAMKDVGFDAFIYKAHVVQESMHATSDVIVKSHLNSRLQDSMIENEDVQLLALFGEGEQSCKQSTVDMACMHDVCGMPNLQSMMQEEESYQVDDDFLGSNSPKEIVMQEKLQVTAASHTQEGVSSRDVFEGYGVRGGEDTNLSWILQGIHSFFQLFGHCIGYGWVRMVLLLMLMSVMLWMPVEGSQCSYMLVGDLKNLKKQGYVMLVETCDLWSCEFYEATVFGQFLLMPFDPGGLV